ncbi:MAG: iron chelate uptake ABC transporter family permease subunit, partial [candidate division NC10 bacterium]
MKAGVTLPEVAGWRSVPILCLAALLLIGLLLSVMVGSIPVAPREAVRALLTGGANDPVVAVVRQIRLPRAILAGMVGAALALAGLGFQAISRNPLADPTVLGVSSGASFGVVIAMLLGL